MDSSSVFSIPIPLIQWYVAGAGRGDPREVSPHTFRHSIALRMIRRENKRLEDVMLHLRHANLQPIDEVSGHFRR